MRLVDLSVIIENTPSEPMRIKIKKVSHKRGAKKIARESHYKNQKSLIKKIVYLSKYLFGKKLISNKDFPDEEFISLDTITMPTHMGTHIDAPSHFGSKCEGKQARTIEQLPLDMFFGRGILLDLRYKKPGEFILVEDIEKALNVSGHTLRAGDIILLWTGMEEKWGTSEYFTKASGMSEDSTAYLVERGIKVIGIDSYGFDRPFGVMIQDFLRTKDNKVLWPAHFFGRKKEYVHIERLTNLASLEGKEFTVCCFPLPIKGADASWSRVVAIVDDDNTEGCSD